MYSLTYKNDAADAGSNVDMHRHILIKTGIKVEKENRRIQDRLKEVNSKCYNLSQIIRVDDATLIKCEHDPDICRGEWQSQLDALKDEKNALLADREENDLRLPAEAAGITGFWEEIKHGFETGIIHVFKNMGSCQCGNYFGELNVRTGIAETSGWSGLPADCPNILKSQFKMFSRKYREFIDFTA